ncbi:MAG: hypothetical protein KA143_00495 [Saprospiraceae bacterium]|nr:hypothetical protein [Saprospiraceae bacterium]
MHTFLKSICILLLLALSLAMVSDVYNMIANQNISIASAFAHDFESNENGESEEQKKEIDDDEKFISFSRKNDSVIFISFDYVLRHTNEIQSKSFKATLIQPPDEI